MVKPRKGEESVTGLLLADSSPDAQYARVTFLPELTHASFH